MQILPVTAVCNSMHQFIYFYITSCETNSTWFYRKLYVNIKVCICSHCACINFIDVLYSFLFPLFLLLVFLPCFIEVVLSRAIKGFGNSNEKYVSDIQLSHFVHYIWGIFVEILFAGSKHFIVFKKHCFIQCSVINILYPM